VTASLMDYALPRAEDAPSFAFETRNVRCATNPLGVKGAGEAGAIGSAPAVMNAVVDALHRAFRIRHVDMPPLAGLVTIEGGVVSGVIKRSRGTSVQKARSRAPPRPTRRRGS
jgi:hypothetical protein